MSTDTIKPAMFSFCEYSNTIRKNPENYIVAFRNGHWVCDPDAAIHIDLKVSIFKIIVGSHDLRWGSPEKLVNALNVL